MSKTETARERPRSGGSFVRESNGELKKQAGTETPTGADPAEDAKAAAKTVQGEAPTPVGDSKASTKGADGGATDTEGAKTSKKDSGE